MISKTGVNALRALAALSKLPLGGYAGAEEIALKIDAPRNYLGKLLKSLADKGLLISQKGKGGGFRLARDASKISLYEVIHPFEHIDRWGNCLLDHRPCAAKAPCALHEKWGKVRDAYLQFLRETAVDDITIQTSSPVSALAKEP